MFEEDRFFFGEQRFNKFEPLADIPAPIIDAESNHELRAISFRNATIAWRFMSSFVG